MVHKFIRRQTPGGDLVLNVGRHPRIGAEELKDATDVVLVLPRYFPAARVGRSRPLVAVADPVAGHAFIGVPIRFATREAVCGADIMKDAIVEGSQVHRTTAGSLGGEITTNHFIVGGLIVERWGQRQAVRGLGQAEAEVVGLDEGIRRAGCGRCAGTDAGDEAAGGVAGRWVWIDREIDERADGRCQDAVFGFAMGGIGLAPHPECDACGCQQIAFVGGIDKHPGADHKASAGFDFADDGPDFFDCGQRLIQQRRHRSGRQPVLKNGGRNFGFKEIFPNDGIGCVFPADPQIKIGRKAAD